MSTRILIAALVSVFLVLVLLPTGLGAPELIGLSLIAVASVSLWRWRQHKPRQTAA